jgi:hypothetical protein
MVLQHESWVVVKTPHRETHGCYKMPIRTTELVSLFETFGSDSHQALVNTMNLGIP